MFCGRDDTTKHRFKQSGNLKVETITKRVLSILRHYGKSHNEILVPELGHW